MELNCVSEVWKQIPSHPNYEILKNENRIRRVSNHYEVPIKAYDNRYYACCCGYIHRVMYETFVAPIPKNLTINHKNGVKTDNRIENLELMTQAENNKHAIVTGLHKTITGENNPQATLNEGEVVEIFKQAWENNLSLTEIANKHNISRGLVQSIKNKRRWKATTDTFEREYLKNNGFEFIKYKKHSRQKFLEEDIINIYKDILKHEMAYRKIAENHKISASYIIGIKNKKYWKDLTDSYDRQVK